MFSGARLFGCLFMRLPAIFLNRQLPCLVPGHTRFVRKDLAGKPDGPKHKDHARRRDDYVFRQWGPTGLLQAVPESAELQFGPPKTIDQGLADRPLRNGPKKLSIEIKIG